MMGVVVLVVLNGAFPLKRRERSIAVDVDEDRLLRAVMGRGQWVQPRNGCRSMNAFS